MKILLLLLIAAALTVCAQPCEDYTCDSLVVREILDANGLDTITVKRVSANLYVQRRIDALDLNYMGLDTLPECLGRLSALAYLDAQGNNIRVLPRTIGQLPVVILDFSENEISELPEQMGNLKYLFSLNLARNQLSSLPSAMVNLDTTLDLVVVYNRLCALPKEILAWVNACNHVLDWQSTQDCTPVRRPLIGSRNPTPLSPNATVMLHDLHGRLLGAMPFVQVNDMLTRMSSGTYLLVLPAGEGVVKAVVPGR